MLVTFTDAGPAIANLLLDGVHGADVFTYPMRNLMSALDSAVATEPLRAAGELFHAGEQRFVLKNAAGQPITVRGTFPGGRDFTPAPSQIERTLAPGASEEVVVQVRAAYLSEDSRVERYWNRPRRSRAVGPGRLGRRPTSAMQ